MASTELRAAAQQALEYMKSVGKMDMCPEEWAIVGRLEAALAEPEACTWQQDGDSDSGVYGTSCGSYFDITDGTPEDNKMAWCCYCGKKLAQSLITEDEDD